jgi:hypothetical protein
MMVNSFAGEFIYDVVSWVATEWRMDNNKIKRTLTMPHLGAFPDNDSVVHHLFVSTNKHPKGLSHQMTFLSSINEH